MPCFCFFFYQDYWCPVAAGAPFSHKNSASLLTELIPRAAITLLVWWGRCGWSNGENCRVMLMHAAWNPMVLAQDRTEVILKVDWKYWNQILIGLVLTYTVKSVSADMQVCVLHCCSRSSRCTVVLSFSILKNYWRWSFWWSFCMSVCLQVRFVHLHNLKGKFKWRICQTNRHLNASYSILCVAASVAMIVSHTLIPPLDFGFYTQAHCLNAVGLHKYVIRKLISPLTWHCPKLCLYTVLIISLGVSLWNSSTC